MPHLDGYEATQQIRDFYDSFNASQPYIIACTGHVESSYIDKAWAYKMDEVLGKPASLETLKDVLKEVIRVQDNWMVYYII
jgi:CheY-like chemotaxis protein